MSKALELLANIDKKYNNELKHTEEQLLSGIEQTSQIIRDSLNTRANITATAIQQSDEKIAQSIRKQRPDGREAVKPVSSLAAIEIEPFNAAKRRDTEPRTASPESSHTEKTYHFEYGADFSSSYFTYSDFLAWSRQQKQVQRDADAKQRDQRATNQGQSVEPIRRQPEYRDVQSAQQQIPTSMHPDQRETGPIRERLLHSNGVLSDDRIRNTIIENHRRTTATITATTSAIAEATASFRHNANQDYPSLVSTVKGNRERSEKLTASTEIISDNTEAISRARQKHSELYQSDQWQSNGNEPNHCKQREHTEENISHTSLSVVRSRAGTAELAQNFSNIETSLKDVAQQKLERHRDSSNLDLIKIEGWIFIFRTCLF